MLSARRSSNACSIGKRRDPLTRTTSPFLPSLLFGADRCRTFRVSIVVVAVAWMICAWPDVGHAGQRTEPAQPAAAAAEPAQPAAAAAEPAQSHGAQPPGEPAEPPAKAAAGEHGAAESKGEHVESPWALVARLFNFAILAGALVYLLRSPLVGYLEQRGVHVRSELTKAAELRRDASAQLEQIEAKLKGLPGEVEALKRRGAEEIAAEGSRIHALAETERRRLLEQATREIETQLRIAERDLKKRAGELAVDVATERVKRTITVRDHARLVDRYVEQVRH